MKVRAFFLMVIGLVLLSALPVQAASREAGLQQVTINAAISEDGAVAVTETVVPSYLTANQELAVSLGSVKPQGVKITLNGVIVDKKNYSIKSENNSYLAVFLEPQNGTLQFQYQLNGIVRTKDELETLQWSPIKQPGIVNYLSLTVTLPKAVTKETIESNIYASVNSAYTRSETVNDSTINLTASSIAPDTEIAAMVRWPQGLIAFSFWQRLINSLGEIYFFIWLGIGVIIPLIALGAMLRLVWLNKIKEEISTVELINHAPDGLIAAQVGVLYNKKLYPKDIVATIISFATRGYIILVDHGTHLTIGKHHPPDNHMSAWEKAFYQELFSKNGTSTNEAAIDRRIAKSLSSAGIVKLYEEIYQEVNSFGFFVGNPHFVRMNYKARGLAFYLISLVLMLWVLIMGKTAVYIFPIVGLLIVAFTIIKLSNRVTPYSSTGLEERIKWQHFRNWMADPNPLPYDQINLELFYAYLPYAIALNCYEQWVNRFRTQALVIPEWYTTLLNQDSASFNEKIIPIINSISTKLASLHGPAVN